MMEQHCNHPMLLDPQIGLSTTTTSASSSSSSAGAAATTATTNATNAATNATNAATAATAATATATIQEGPPHPCFPVLDSKTNGTKKLNERKEMLLNLITPAIETYLKSALDQTSHNEVKDWFQSVRVALKGKAYLYRLSQSAEHICSFDRLISRIS